MQKEKSLKNLKLILSVLLMLFLIAATVLVIVFRTVVIEFLREVLSGDASLKSFMQSLGLGGYLLIIGLQTVQFLIMGFPPEPIYFAAGISYGTLIGTVICVGGIVIGSQILWAIYKIFKKNPKRNKKSRELGAELKERINKSQKNMWYVIIAAYILPVVPFGLIAIVLINFKPKYWKYTLITTVGAIIPVLLSVFLGETLSSSHVHPGVTLAILIVIMAAVIVSLLNKNRIMNWIFRDKKTLDQKISKMKARKPNRTIYTVFKHIYKKSVFDKNNAHIIYETDIKSLKQPFLVVANHPSTKDFVYFGTALLPHRVTHVINRYFYHSTLLGFLLKRAGTIPKKLYQSDTKSMKEILRVVSEGRAVGLAPEGINSVNGRYMGMRPGIEKLIKHLGIPVILVKINGAFLTSAKWRGKEPARKGRIDIHVSQLFSAEEVAETDKKEIFERVDKALYYDDYEWAAQNKVEFSGGNLASGVERAIYLCPRCGGEFKIKAEGDTIECTECHNGANINKYYGLEPFDDDCVIPQNFGEWYDLQRESVFNCVKSTEESVLMRSFVKLKMFNKSGKKEIEVGEGILTLTKDGLDYAPSGGKEVTLSIPCNNLPGIALNMGESVELYVGDDFYLFAFENGLHSVKWAIAIEQNFNYLENKA